MLPSQLWDGNHILRLPGHWVLFVYAHLLHLIVQYTVLLHVSVPEHLETALICHGVVWLDRTTPLCVLMMVIVKKYKSLGCSFERPALQKCACIVADQVKRTIRHVSKP